MGKLCLPIYQVLAPKYDRGQMERIGYSDPIWWHIAIAKSSGNTLCIVKRAEYAQGSFGDLGGFCSQIR
jgi:hypothetical protein